MCDFYLNWLHKYTDIFPKTNKSQKFFMTVGRKMRFHSADFCKWMIFLLCVSLIHNYLAENHQISYVFCHWLLKNGIFWQLFFFNCMIFEINYINIQLFCLKSAKFMPFHDWLSFSCRWFLNCAIYSINTQIFQWNHQKQCFF